MKKLEDFTWEEIDGIVKQGKHKELFKIGDTKSFKIGLVKPNKVVGTVTSISITKSFENWAVEGLPNKVDGILDINETLVAQIADFDHDDLSDGTGKAGISFIIKDCVNTTHNMNSSDTNYGGWSGSDMRKYLNDDIYNQLPSDLQSVIKPVNKVTSKGNKSSELETSTDKLWLMSEKEAFGTNSYSPCGEGTQYPIFTDNTSRIKKVNGSASWYWLRSPYVNYSTCFCNVGYGGSSYYSASGSGGVAFGFCI